MEVFLGWDEESSESLRIQRHGQLRLGSATGCPFRRIEWMKPCISRWVWLHICKPWSSLDICATAFIIYWRDSMLKQRPSQRFLACVNDNFFLQVIEETARRDAVL